MSFYILSPLPTTAGGTGTIVAPTVGQVPIGNANGTYTPGTVSAGTPGGSTTQIQYNNAGAFAGLANLVTDGTNLQINNQAALRFSNATTNYVAFKAPASIASNVNWTLPSTDGTAGQVLSTNGSGVLSWVTVTITPSSPTNNTLPVVSGTPTVGQTLSSTSGTWNGYPAPTFGYQWVRGASTNISGATSSSYQLVDADYNTTVKCTVTATNSAGSASATSAATATIAAGVPGAPTIGTATRGDAQATVPFTAPAITGGVAITSYTVTSSPGGITASGSTSPITVTGLTNGTAYTFTVTATNSVGTGPASAASNSVTPQITLPVEYLVVAGGGGGGFGGGGGGGAGGYLTASGFSVTVSDTYTLTVGAGGAAGSSSVAGSRGSNSVFSTITSTGGGGGGTSNAVGAAGTTGGSGGGGYASNNSGLAGNTPSTTPSQGNNGGNAALNGCGGGGGSGSVGANASGSNGGNGGTATSSSITGTAVYYAGGGGGGGYNSGATVGLGGGTATVANKGGASDGTKGGGSAAADGTANTGGGAGGGGYATAGGNLAGGAGGSGVVIIAYPSTYAAITNIPGTLTYSVSTSSRTGYRVYTFTAGTGTITW